MITRGQQNVGYNLKMKVGTVTDKNIMYVFCNTYKNNQHFFEKDGRLGRRRLC
jgi:hypothetical protein